MERRGKAAGHLGMMPHRHHPVTRSTSTFGRRCRGFPAFACGLPGSGRSLAHLRKVALSHRTVKGRRGCSIPFARPFEARENIAFTNSAKLFPAPAAIP